MVGGHSTDVEAGRSAGCATVYIDLCYEEPAPDTPDYVVHWFLDVGHGWIGKASARAFSGRGVALPRLPFGLAAQADETIDSVIQRGAEKCKLT
jgi:hypothetical protein